MNTAKETEWYIACYIQGMKSLVKAHSMFKHNMRKIEKALDHHSETKRVDIKRVLMRFSKEHMLGFKLETLEPLPKENDDPFKLTSEEARDVEMNYEVNSMALASKKLNSHNPINKDFSAIIKSLNEKYVPMYDLKWDSKMEGIE